MKEHEESPRMKKAEPLLPAAEADLDPEDQAEAPTGETPPPSQAETSASPEPEGSPSPAPATSASEKKKTIHRRSHAEIEDRVRNEMQAEVEDRQRVIDGLRDDLARIQVEARLKQPLINILVPQIMALIEPIAKKHRNDEGGFNFRMIDEMTAPLNGILASKGVFVVPHKVKILSSVEKLARDGSVLFYRIVKVKWRITCADSSFIPAESLGEGMSDMHFSTASAQTMALKQVLWQLFMIPVLGAADPEQEGIRAVGDATLAAAAPERHERRPEPEQASLIPSAVEESEAPAEQTASGPEKSAPAERPKIGGLIGILRSHLKNFGKDEAELLKHFGVEQTEDLLKEDFEKYLAWVKQ